VTKTHLRLVRRLSRRSLCRGSLGLTVRLRAPQRRADLGRLGFQLRRRGRQQLRASSFQHIPRSVPVPNLIATGHMVGHKTMSSTPTEAQLRQSYNQQLQQFSADAPCSLSALPHSCLRPLPCCNYGETCWGDYGTEWY